MKLYETILNTQLMLLQKDILTFSENVKIFLWSTPPNCASTFKYSSSRAYKILKNFHIYSNNFFNQNRSKNNKVSFQKNIQPVILGTTTHSRAGIELAWRLLSQLFYNHAEKKWRKVQRNISTIKKSYLAFILLNKQNHLSCNCCQSKNIQCIFSKS